MSLLALSPVDFEPERLDGLRKAVHAATPCNITYLDPKLEETNTEKANGKGKFCGAIKWLPFITGSSSTTERYTYFLLGHFLAFAQWP